jgi:hypothetical protein
MAGLVELELKLQEHLPSKHEALNSNLSAVKISKYKINLGAGDSRLLP